MTPEDDTIGAKADTAKEPSGAANTAETLAGSGNSGRVSHRHPGAHAGGRAATPGRLEIAHRVAEIVQAGAATIALAAAAWWFMHQRLVDPHANITHTVQSAPLTANWRLITLVVDVKNVGEVPLRLGNGTVYIQRVLPLEPRIQQEIAKGDSPINATRHRVLWPVIGHEYKVSVDSIIAPGESEDEAYDFIIPASICEIELHSSYLDQVHTGWEWTDSSLYKIRGCKNAS